jgi:hypothetical protein
MRPDNVLPREGSSEEVPPVPAGYDLGPAGLGWWEFAWSTPQASKWDRSAVMIAARRALLEDLMIQITMRGDEIGPGHLKAISDLEDRLGLSPRALLGLRWELEPKDSDEQQSGDVILLNAQ